MSKRMMLPLKLIGKIVLIVVLVVTVTASLVCEHSSMHHALFGFRKTQVLRAQISADTRHSMYQVANQPLEGAASD